MKRSAIDVEKYLQNSDLIKDLEDRMVEFTATEQNK